MLTILLKMSFLVLITYTFYKLIIEKETFFNANRAFLLISLLCTLLLPFVSLPELTNNQGAITEFIEQIDSETTTLSLTNINQPNIVISDDPSFTQSAGLTEKKSFVNWILMIYLFGVAILIANLIFQIAGLIFKIVRTEDKIQDSNYTIINSSKIKEPCSFFKYIFLNPRAYENDIYEQILEHEKIHVTKYHTIDLLISELMIIILWFNPLIWLFRREVEKNVEYQTDSIILESSNTQRENYQMNLLKIAAKNMPLAITTNYNQSLIKMRILKMNSKKSNPYNYWKYAFTIPLLFVSLLFLNKPHNALSQATNEIPVLLNEINSTCGELIEAVTSKDMAKVSELLMTTDPNCIFVIENETRQPRSALVAAARVGSLDIGKLIIRSGGSPNYFSKDDESPLMAAAQQGNLEFVKLLVLNKANVNHVSSSEGTALILASENGHLEIVKYLISNDSKVNSNILGTGTALIAAVKNGHLEIAEILLRNGADPYLGSSADGYPMNYAQINDNEEMLELLKNSNANN